MFNVESGDVNNPAGFCSPDLGATQLLDEALHVCSGLLGNCDANHSRPNTWWYAIVLLNESAFGGAPSQGGHDSPFFRSAMASHELGHALGLAHDYSPGNGEISDGDCNTLLPKTIMDFDCTEAGHDTNDFIQTDVAWFWDSCGLNHKYPDPSWTNAGCADAEEARG